MSRPIQVVVDTNVVVSLLRLPVAPPKDKISVAVAGRLLCVVADKDGGILGEWENTANRDFVRQLLIYWEQFGGWKLVSASRLPAVVVRNLRRLGFTDAVDHVVLRTAVGTDDRRVVSNDPDFWDPRDRERMGHINAPIARLCRESLQVAVSTLVQLVNEVFPPLAVPGRTRQRPGRGKGFRRGRRRADES